MPRTVPATMAVWALASVTFVVRKPA